MGSCRRRMSVDEKQIEWVWEYFLKNCTDARMIQELLIALPFPNDNLDIKRLYWLRTLSLRNSSGKMDELTLAMLRGLGELSKVSGATKERHPVDEKCQEAAKRRKTSEDESNDDEAGCSAVAMNSSTPQATDGRVLPPTWNLDQHRESCKDSRKAETVVGISDSMKGRALPRSVGGSGSAEEELEKGSSHLNYGGTSAVNSGTPHGAGNRPSGGEYVFRPGQFAKQWEVELAVMLELAVQHLRGDSPDRKSFEHAVTKHWGDSALDDAGRDGWPAADSLEMERVREQIKNELWMVRRNPELLDDVVEKYTKARVEDMLKGYLEKALASTGQTFLERVSADVKNGKYKPVNCNGQRPRKSVSPLADGEAAGQQSNTGKVDTSEKPCIRASRGRHSRSREKVQKNFAISDLDDGDKGEEINTEDEETRGKQQAETGSKPLDSDEDRANRKTKALDSGEVRPSLSTEGAVESNSRSEKFGIGAKDAGVARVLQFDERPGQGKEDGRQHCEETQETVRPDIENTEAAHLLLQTDGPGAPPGVGDNVEVTASSPVTSIGPDTVKTPGFAVPNVINCSEGKGTSLNGDDDEKRTKAASSPKKTDWLGAEPGSPHEVVNKENVVPPSSPKPSVANPTVCFSPPPWVEGSPAAHAADKIAPGVTRKRKSGSFQGETGNEKGRQESKGAESVTSTDFSNESSGATTTQRNLRRKQRALDAAVQDPLPKILRTRSRNSLLERNATARNVEWDEDEIEESPPTSPSASRHVRLPPTAGKKISPLVNSKTSTNVNPMQARRKPRRWSEKEVETLKAEVSKYGKGRWKLILEKNLESFEGRTEVDLKDKWRNLEKFEGLTY